MLYSCTRDNAIGAMSCTRETFVQSWDIAACAYLALCTHKHNKRKTYVIGHNTYRSVYFSFLSPDDQKHVRVLRMSVDDSHTCDERTTQDAADNTQSDVWIIGGVHTLHSHANNADEIVRVQLCADALHVIDRPPYAYFSVPDTYRLASAAPARVVYDAVLGHNIAVRVETYVRTTHTPATPCSQSAS